MVQRAQEDLQTAIAADVIERGPYHGTRRRLLSVECAGEARERVLHQFRRPAGAGSEQDPLRVVRAPPCKAERLQRRSRADVQPREAGYGGLVAGGEEDAAPTQRLQPPAEARCAGKGGKVDACARAKQAPRGRRAAASQRPPQPHGASASGFRTVSRSPRTSPESSRRCRTGHSRACPPAARR